MNKHRKYIIGALLLLSTSYKGMGQETMMTEVSVSYLENLISLAKFNYPRMKMYNHKIELAKTNVQRAKLGWFDLLTFTYLYSPTGTTTLVNPSYSGGYQVGVYFNAGTLLTKGPGVKLAKQDLLIAEDNLAEYNLNLEAEVKRRYYIYVKNMTLLQLRVKNANDIEAALKEVKYRFGRGEESMENYTKNLNLQSLALQLKIEAEEAYLTAKSSLEEIIGDKLKN